MALTEQQIQRAKEYFNTQQKTTVGDFMRGYAGQTAEENNIGFLEKVKESLFNRASKAKEALQLGSKLATEEGAITPVESAVRVVGQGAGFIGDILGAVIEPAVKPIVEKIAETETGKKAFTAINQGQQIYDNWKKESIVNDRIGKSIEGLVNIAAIMPIGTGAKVGKELTGQAIEQAGKTGAKVLEKAALGVEKVKPVIETQKNIISDIATSGKEFIEKIPERTAVKQAERVAQEKFIQEIPDSLQQSVKRVITEGVDSNDIKEILNTTKKERVVLKEVLDNTKKYASGIKDKDPAKTVGQIVRKPFEDVDVLLEKEGKNLGSIVKQTKTITKKIPNIQERIFNALKQVNGLEDLRLRGGKLDFTNTTLSGTKNKTARESLIEEFTEIASKNPYQLHLKRQELFDILGGRKKANLYLIETEEKGLQSIRNELSNILDEISPTYKKLNAKYAPLANIRTRFRKFFKNTLNADEDILDIQAGNLARRLTSNAQSNAELRQLLRDVSTELSKRGIKETIDPVKAQEFYNLLSKYYNIAAPTGFAGQTNLGINMATGRGVLGKIAEETLGRLRKTEQSTQKMLEDFINKLDD